MKLYFVIAGIAAGIISAIVIALNMNNQSSSTLAPGHSYTQSQYVHTNDIGQIELSVCSLPHKASLLAKVQASNGTAIFSQTLSHMPYYSLINSTDGRYTILITNTGNESAVVKSVLTAGFRDPQHALFNIPYACESH